MWARVPSQVCSESVRPQAAWNVLTDLDLAIARWRPYRVECTGSLLTSEVKRLRARLVLGSGTALKYLRVLSAFANHALSSCMAMMMLVPKSKRPQSTKEQSGRDPFELGFVSEPPN